MGTESSNYPCPFDKPLAFQCFQPVLNILKLCFAGLGDLSVFHKAR